MTICARCGHPVPEPGVFLVRPRTGSTFVDVCSDICGAQLDRARQGAW